MTHYVNSSIWPALKTWFSVVKDCSSWVTGDGASVNFWTVRWLKYPLVESLNISSNWHNHFEAKVKDFIIESGVSLILFIIFFLRLLTRLMTLTSMFFHVLIEQSGLVQFREICPSKRLISF